MALVFDAIRHGNYRGAVKAGCESPATSVELPDAATKAERGIVDLVVLDGDHSLFQRLGSDYVPTVDCIILVAVVQNGQTKVVQVLVELKEGSLQVGNVHGKFKHSWTHANAVLSEVGLPRHTASLHVLGAGLHKDDRKRLVKGLAGCGGHQVAFHSGNRRLSALLPA